MYDQKIFSARARTLGTKTATLIHYIIMTDGYIKMSIFCGVLEEEGSYVLLWKLFYLITEFRCILLLQIETRKTRSSGFTKILEFNKNIRSTWLLGKVFKLHITKRILKCLLSK